jgi:hypothetical protein
MLIYKDAEKYAKELKNISEKKESIKMMNNSF